MSIILNRYKKHWPLFLFLITNTLLVLAVFSKISHHSEYLHCFFSSDALYLPSIYKDIFQDGNSVAGWHLNPAPNFFPDMVVYFVFMFFAGNLIFANLLFAIFQYVIIAFILYRIYKVLFGADSQTALLAINLLLSVFLLETILFSGDFLYSFYILINAYHTGSFVLTLLCLYLTLEYITNLRPYLVFLLFFLQLLGVLSDRLFIVSFIVPLVVTVVLLFKTMPRAQTWFLVITATLSLWQGLRTFNWLSEGHLVNIDPPQSLYDFSNIYWSLNQYYSQMCLYLTQPGFRQISVLLSFVSLPLLAFMFLRHRQELSAEMKFYLVFSLLFSVTVIATPILNGSYLQYDNFRYNVNAFFMFPLNLVVFGQYCVKWRPLRIAMKPIGIVLLLLSVVVSVRQLKKEGLSGFLNYYPEQARQLDSIAPARSFFCGVGNYWEAKRITLFSRKGIRVYAVHDDFATYMHVANEKWFYGDNIFNFAVLNRFSDTTFLRKRLKDVKVICNNKDLKLVQVSPFMFKKENGRNAINIGYNEKTYDK